MALVIEDPHSTADPVLNSGSSVTKRNMEIFKRMFQSLVPVSNSNIF